ncbi:unnamed protein product [Lactuca saligna]|uniref:K+ potassium transporter integral membrane domain-containing protein n=1 Tax=Lactuca saligna TaxID=75948 RepID=A0AA35ZT56_LACSI|nr:unnamed protein product [Lactuca saligna]
MSAIPPSDAPVLPSSSMSSIDLEDQNQFSRLSDDVFVGCFMSMSSTTVVVKLLVKKNSNNALNGQVTIGTLIFQIYITVMNWFLLAAALLLVTFITSTDDIGTAYEVGVMMMTTVLVILVMLLIWQINIILADDIVNKSVWCISFKTWSIVPCFLNRMVQLSSQMTVKDALNSALVEEMAAGSSIFIMGEEVGEYQGA